MVTPVNAFRLRELLQQANYPENQTDFLFKGFNSGFFLGYNGRTDVKLHAHNFRLCVGNQTILWNKVMKEVKLKRFAGPFREIPFTNFTQSPIGLVPKDGGSDVRLIFHLSYLKGGTTSVNANTPHEECWVTYTDFDEAIRLCMALTSNGEPLVLAKSDVDSAFHNLGLEKQLWRWAILKAVSPLDQQTYFFVDKCLPFGSSISCALFQKVSDVVAFMVKFRMKTVLINYLDDYLFVAMLRSSCNHQVQVFLNVCKEIQLPVSHKKTYWASSTITFLGFLIDGVNWVVLIPVNKIQKANALIQEFLNPSKKKATVRKIQQLCGFLNFLCRCVVPGRAFTKRLYSGISSKLKPHHHVSISAEMRMDFRVWSQFLAHPTVFCRPFSDFSVDCNATDINLYTDSSRNFLLGCGGVCHQQWFFTGWDVQFMKAAQPSIEYLELYAVTVGVLLWIKRFKNRKILLFCDNQAVVAMINNKSSSCRNCMVLIRVIILEGLKWNVLIKARFL